MNLNWGLRTSLINKWKTKIELLVHWQQCNLIEEKIVYERCLSHECLLGSTNVGNGYRRNAHSGFIIIFL